MHNIAEKIEIKCTSKKIYFTCKGEMASLETELGETANGLSIDVYKDEIVQGLFELKNLSSIYKMYKSMSYSNSIY